MKKTAIGIIFVLVAGAFLSYNIATAASKTAKWDLTLISKKVKSAPADAASSQWNQAKESKFFMTGQGKFEGKFLELKAKSVYTKDKLFFRFEWPDETLSMNKKRWKYTGGKWTHLKGDEDRLGVAFEIHRVDKFATKGCAVFCHNDSKNVKDWYMAVNSPKEKIDLWHWKSVRSNPVGYTEDGWMGTNPSKKPEEGRHRDAGSATTKARHNRTKDKSKPAYMQDPAKTPSIPGSLLVSEAVPIKDYSMFKDDAEIPSVMLYKVWKDSFADVKTQGVWKNHKWTLIMSRKLKTGNDDDTQFNTRKKYPFTLATFDNDDHENKYASAPLKLQFK